MHLFSTEIFLFPDEILSPQLRQDIHSDIHSFISGRMWGWLVYGTYNIFSKFVLPY